MPYIVLETKLNKAKHVQEEIKWEENVIRKYRNNWKKALHTYANIDFSCFQQREDTN